MLIVIPTRLNSLRLPGKPLRMIGDEPLIRCVVRRVQTMNLDAEVVVATDAPAVEEAVAGAAPVVMTSSSHRNGTERVVEVARLFGTVEMVVNVQGDMPSVPREAVLGAVARVERGDDVGTVVAPVPEDKDMMIADPNRVKVVVDGLGQCVAFYRLASWGVWPFPPLAMGLAEHVGVYAYQPDTLQRWISLPPTKLEQALRLEQVRVMGELTIGATWLPGPAPLAIDTEETLALANRLAEVPK